MRKKALYFIQVEHLRNCIFFRFVIGLGDNIIAKCKLMLAYSRIFLFVANVFMLCSMLI